VDAAVTASEPWQNLPGIAAVERDTGISKDTLRVWERRYGFPAPLRDATGERVYPAAQVQRLRVLKRLLDAGHRPGRVVPLQADVPVEAAEFGVTGLPALPPQAARESVLAPGFEVGSELSRYLALLRSHEVTDLRRALQQALLRQGLRAFVLDVVVPFTTQVGELWMRGELEVFEEHLYTETMQQVLRQAMQSTPPLALMERPRVLLTTLTGEQHAMGLLMAEALLTLEGCPCLWLGVQTPQEELPRAVAAHRADILALSFSGYLPAGVMQRGLAAVRAELDKRTEMWAGGRGATLKQRRHRVDGVHYVTQLTDIAAQVQRWRDTNAAKPPDAPANVSDVTLPA
jgi:methanogenic corrinoid protein MtbC1